jgi:sulfane dehydrogenase subunit SoxC
MRQDVSQTATTDGPGPAGERRVVVTSDPFNCETPLDQVQGWITPTALHFVRSSYGVPAIDATTWALRVEGEVDRPLDLMLDDLRAMPSRSQVCWMECAGNARSLYGSVQGRPITSEQLPWGVGAVSNAEWTGVPLGDVLQRAGVRDGAVEALIEGLDSGKRKRPIPIDVAMAPTTLLAYALNGDPLPRDNGYPVRALVPGWAGISSIKWVGRIVVSREPVVVDTNTTSYVLEGDAYPEPKAITHQPIKSVVALPWDGEVSAGPRRVRGFAWSPHGRISRVEVSLDDGTSWTDATLVEPVQPLAWVRWELPWEPAPGRYTIATRAHDERGNHQPDSVPWNRLGYLYNAVIAHPITVR